ncbi:tribbles homolog 2 isoform X1 [Octopus sinensis]|nr:tribbles homolog 2 isoform X1 [Octopus sinensis]
MTDSFSLHCTPMSGFSRSRPRTPSYYASPREEKTAEVVDPTPATNPGNLSPDLQPSYTPDFPKACGNLQLEKYTLIELREYKDRNVYKAHNTHTNRESICKVFPVERYREVLSTYWQVDCHSNISGVEEVILDKNGVYLFFKTNYGDLHSYVRQKKRLKEAEACRLFRQVVEAVAHCHEHGVVLRDLKLRKFVFADPEKTHLLLEGLEDACLLEDESDDRLTDKHGCPAYVSPEILSTATESYSGKAADIWSLGVMLYTMIIGRYPFHDTEPSALFGKIRRGQYSLPDILSSGAKCLIRNMLRRDPTQRLTADVSLLHPWLAGHWPSSSVSQTCVDRRQTTDQTVPNIKLTELKDDLFD